MTAITIFFFLFLGVAAILLLFATSALHRHSTTSSNSPKALPLKDLKKLPRFRFSTKTRPETGADQSSCVVCLEEIKQGQWCRNLVGCGHVFHRKCVDAWLVKVSACPICRTRVELDQGVKDRPLWDFVWRNELKHACSVDNSLHDICSVLNTKSDFGGWILDCNSNATTLIDNCQYVELELAFVLVFVVTTLDLFYEILLLCFFLLLNLLFAWILGHDLTLCQLGKQLLGKQYDAVVE
ncbi:hypothetical protein POTOM_057401 [Populus tomentosa]|uniref:RING-type domain-containing protein n=1 Tax=Populus tomentosa TaxID=118781 RepID=A0A8X7XWD8_POPTO|nr:hypothetical protein POTOM_057401 [Populus tomentosa]